MNCIACALFLSNKFISYVAFYIGPIQTGFLRGFQKKLRRNRNRDSCEKSATGTENKGIRRIPAGIGNLGHKVAAIHDSYTLTRYLSQMLGFFWVTCGIKMMSLCQWLRLTANSNWKTLDWGGKEGKGGGQ